MSSRYNIGPIFRAHHSSFIDNSGKTPRHDAAALRNFYLVPVLLSAATWMLLLRQPVGTQKSYWIALSEGQVTLIATVLGIFGALLFSLLVLVLELHSKYKPIEQAQDIDGQIEAKGKLAVKNVLQQTFNTVLYCIVVSLISVVLFFAADLSLDWLKLILFPFAFFFMYLSGGALLIILKRFSITFDYDFTQP